MGRFYAGEWLAQADISQSCLGTWEGEAAVSQGARKTSEGFPGGPVVRNPAANAGDTGLIPGPGRSRMLQKNHAQVTQLLSLHAEITEDGIRDSQGVWDGHVHTAMFKMITNKHLLYGTWNSAPCCVAAWMGGEFGGENGY